MNIQTLKQTRTHVDHDKQYGSIQHIQYIQHNILTKMLVTMYNASADTAVNNGSLYIHVSCYTGLCSYIQRGVLGVLSSVHAAGYIAHYIVESQ